MFTASCKFEFAHLRIVWILRISPHPLSGQNAFSSPCTHATTFTNWPATAINTTIPHIYRPVISQNKVSRRIGNHRGGHTHIEVADYRCGHNHSPSPTDPLLRSTKRGFTAVDLCLKSEVDYRKGSKWNPILQ